MEGKQLESGETLTVRVFVPKNERPQQAEPFNNLFVKNFPASDSGEPYTEVELRRVFEGFGPIVSAKVDDSGKFGFVCFEDPAHAAKALSVLGESEEGGLYVSKMVKRDLRRKQLRLDMLKSMRQVAKSNLYFKGFPCDGSATIEELQTELKTYFESFGEVKNLKVMTRSVTVEGLTREELLGFGYVSFHTLEAAQKARFEAGKALFRDAHKLYVNQFEWKELRAGHRMERMDQIELGRYLRAEKTKKANEVLSSVRDDLQTEQGQLLLRVLKLITEVNQKKAKEAQEARDNEESKDAAAPAEEAEEAKAEPVPVNPNQAIMSQAYAVRFQTMITGQAFRDADETAKKQMLGAFMFDHVKMFID